MLASLPSLGSSMASETNAANLVWRRSRASKPSRRLSSGWEAWYTLSTSGIASTVLCTTSIDTCSSYNRSMVRRRSALRDRRTRWPLHDFWMRRAAFSRSLSWCLCCRSAWALATVLEAPAAEWGPHEVLVNGFTAFWPLRLTFRAFRELPVKVGNMTLWTFGGEGLPNLAMEGHCDARQTDVFLSRASGT